MGEFITVKYRFNRSRAMLTFQLFISYTDWRGRRNVRDLIQQPTLGIETVTSASEVFLLIKIRAIILKSIEFDDLTVPEVLLYNQKFYPDWPDQPNFITNDLYFGYNGKYIYEFGNDSWKLYYNNLLKKELLANIHNKQLIQLPNGEEIESFEFNGKLVSANAKESVSLQELYERVTNEN